jgi:hypothetical protein
MNAASTHSIRIPRRKSTVQPKRAVRRVSALLSPGLPAAVVMLLALLLSAPGAASALDGSLHGSYKSYLSGLSNLYLPAANENRLYGRAWNSLRLDSGINLGRSISLNLSYLLTPEASSADLLGSLQATGDSGSGYRAFDLPDRLYPLEDGKLENLGLYQNLDRARLAAYLPLGDLYLGRQAISWGSARVINPTDIIAPYSFSRIDTEEKPGVDALRLRIPFGMMNEFDLGFVAGEELELTESALFARTKLYLLQTDISLLVMDFQENLLAGLDLTRSIGGAGSWAEAAWVLPGTFSGSGAQPDAAYLTVSAGLDYNFTGTLYGYAEYHYNGAGAAQATDYPTPAEISLAPADYPAYTEGSVELLGRHYLSAGGTYQITPLLPLSLMAMVNLQDPSANISLSAEYNVTEGVYLTGGCYLGVGRKPETAMGSISEYRSEFGASPMLFYSGMKVYF